MCGVYTETDHETLSESHVDKSPLLMHMHNVCP